MEDDASSEESELHTSSFVAHLSITPTSPNSTPILTPTSPPPNPFNPSSETPKVPPLSSSSIEAAVALSWQQEIVKLNVGGVFYTTTKTTLCSSGTNYFCALFSNHFKLLYDETGAIFIDRNGEYFAPILEFLRVGELDVPKHISLRAIYREAQFYCLQPLLEAIKKLEHPEPEKKLSRLRNDGYYTRKNRDYNEAFLFLAEGIFIYSISAANPVDNLKLYKHLTPVPTIWQTPSTKELYANFVNKKIKKGNFWIDQDNRLRIQIKMDESWLAVIDGNKMFVLHGDFVDYTFEAFDDPYTNLHFNS